MQIARESMARRVLVIEHDMGVALIGGFHNDITNLADVIAHDHM